MKKLKTTLQFKIYILVFITAIYVLLFINVHSFKSYFIGNESFIEGKILTKKIDGNKLTLLIKSKEKVIVYYYFKSEKEKNNFNLEYNDFIRLYGNLEKPNSNTIFNNFNYSKYLKYKGIFYILNSNKIEMIRKNKNFLYEIKEFISNRIDECKKTNSYLKLFILGDKTYIDNEIYNTYININIIHLLTISSIHISMIVLFINKIISKNKYKNIIIITIILLFLFLSNYQISILRAFLCYLMKNFFKNKISNINILIIVICFLLFINPIYIYNIGFIFSSLITFTILFFKKLYVHNKIINSLIISLLAFIVSIPIIINNYYNVNIISFIISTILSPLVTYILFPFSLLTFIFPFLDNFYYFIINIFENICGFFDIDFFNLSFSKIPYMFILIYYLIIFVNNHKVKFIIPLLLVFFYFFNYFSFYPCFYYLDVGQGDSILLRIKNKNVLIDTGGHNNYELEEWKKRNSKFNLIDKSITFFKSIGVKKIDYLIITHGDYDHMGEAINLVNNFKVEKVIFNCGSYNDLEQELIKVLGEKKIPYYSCIKELNIDNKKIYFLQTKEYDNENDNSNVVYTELNGYRFMFMGDASITTEKAIMNKYNLPNIDVLKVGHHGSKTSSGKEFINEINPKYSIISVGKNNRYGHPNKEVLDNLDESKIYRTDQDGSIMFKIKNNKLKIETCSP